LSKYPLLEPKRVMRSGLRVRGENNGTITPNDIE
jgi:hypothetical protein